MTTTKKQTVIQQMTHMDMQALIKKGFSFDALSNHPNLVYRRTMLKRRQQLVRMMNLLNGNPQSVTPKVTYD